MNILKHIYKGGTVAMLMTVIACSTEQFADQSVAPGTTPISLMGGLTRSGNATTLTGYSNLFLSSTIEDGTTDVAYFANKEIAVGEVGTSGNKLTTATFYPLGDKPIKLYAHTGKQENGKIALTSGTDKENDILISNGTDGKGTIGSSSTNAQLLTFRHVMTKLEVAIDVTNTELQETKPNNITIRFKDDLINKSGQYAITSATGEEDKATDFSKETGENCYSLSVGTHYLVPNGKTLSGKKPLSLLKIDDYTAADYDLEAINIPQATLIGGTASDLILKPGLSYKLTFKINRLKVEEITLTMKEWDIETGNGSWGSEPYKVEMDFSGGYNNTEKPLTKMVLRYTPQGGSDIYQYTGKVTGNTIDFLTLPNSMPQGTLSADLYTKDGLLIENDSITYNTSNKFDISLGANGMAKDATGTYEVSTPLQFHNLMSNPEANENYKLIKNIDISHLPLSFTPPQFPKGAILDGNGFSIMHLNLAGNGLFATNKGTLKNLHLSFSSIKATEGEYVGGICAVNEGTIEGCINEADITATTKQTVGGICGKNSGIITACLNTANIPNGKDIGGICGENALASANAINACINAGMLRGSSNHGVTSNIGGICGFQSATSSGSDAVINTCYWLTGTARPIQGNSQEMAIGRFTDGTTATYCTNTTNMIETKLRTEAIGNLNNALGTSSDWEFKWEKNQSGTYKTVWPIPVKKTAP